MTAEYIYLGLHILEYDYDNEDNKGEWQRDVGLLDVRADDISAVQERVFTVRRYTKDHELLTETISGCYLYLKNGCEFKVREPRSLFFPRLFGPDFNSIDLNYIPEAK